jgi:hypothetical protein
MNKVVKELATQARLLTGWPVGEVEYQKFADLIIQECANWIVDNAGSIEHLGPEYFSKAMAIHFGNKK